jgi:two-component system cell cycle response regulator
MYMQPSQHIESIAEVEDELGDALLRQHLEAPNECRVLVVDDDDLVRARLCALLKSANYLVEAASCGAEALRVLVRVHCQIVLTDWQMPDMDGLTLCRNLRADQRDGYIYVVMLTVRSDQQDLLEGLAAGADDYVVKGTAKREILARLEVGRRIMHVEHSLRATNRESLRLSFTDQLTDAHNRRYLVRYLPRELHRAQRYGHPLAVLSCDIDEFKKINDCFGHEAGDELLRHFVARSDSCLRKGSDWLARIGGDEFMIVLPETTGAGANQVARKLRQIIAMEPLLLGGRTITYTASIGVTAVDPRHELGNSFRVEDLLRAADRDMYADKRLGETGVNDDLATCMAIFDAPTGGRHGIN